MPESNTRRNVEARATILTGQLTKSRLFQDYQSAFQSATGHPLYLQVAGYGPEEMSGQPTGNAFCLFMGKSNQSCASCFALQQQLEEEAGMEPRSLQCFAGLCESAVPVRVGANIIAFLQTGKILLHRPDSKRLSRAAQLLIELGVGVDFKQAEDAWFATTGMSEAQYRPMLQLLRIFAGHLSECANALNLEAESVASASVTKAKTVVLAHLEDELSLRRVAKIVNLSAGYFSEIFHKTTGLTFTDYVTRMRVEKVKHLLSNPRLQITTIAYDTGFKSLSQFNRVFKRICGSSPRQYRKNLTGRIKS